MIRTDEGNVLIGDSLWMHYLRQRVARIGGNGAGSVLIYGPPGSGKSRIARAIHAASDRADGPFVTVDCAAGSDGLLQTQLFGHGRGELLVSRHPAIGALLAADGGTLCLRDVDRLSLANQQRLAEELSRRRFAFFRSGGGRPLNVRVIASTRRNLRRQVLCGRFHRDLYRRLAGTRVLIWPLCRRLDDIRPLAHYFLARFAALRGRPPVRLSSDALRILHNYGWPGSVAQLKAVLEDTLYDLDELVLRGRHLERQLAADAARIAAQAVPGHIRPPALLRPAIMRRLLVRHGGSGAQWPLLFGEKHA